jgi:hypothetical protein
VPIADDSPGLPHLLEVDGTNCGYVMSLAGGWGIADVIEEPSPTGVKKRPGPPRWEELELRLALPVARPVFDWIAAAWRREVQAKDLLLTTVDIEGNVLRRREFRNALLTATTIAIEPPAPGSGVSPYEHGSVTLRLLPQAARTTSPTATVAALTPQPPTPLTPRLELTGLDCTMTSPVGTFTVQQAFGSAIPPSPGLRIWREPGPLAFPNLTVELAGNSARDWQRWFDNFVVKGYNDATNEKTGTLTLQDPASEKALVRIGLFNVGIFHLKGPILAGTPRTGISQVTVAELYCERLEFMLP